MGEYIGNIQEKVEGVFGEALASRQLALVNFTGLGPPDLCVLIKSYEPPRFVPGLKPQKLSSFHWVSGVDTSSASSIAVYLGTLVEHQEKSSFGRGSYKIEGCHFCAYNCFLKMDLHVEIGINNSTPVVYSVGASGEKNTVEESFWRETYLSSMLRAIQSPPPFLRPVKILPALKDTTEEAAFLALCHQHFWQGRKLGGLDGEYVDRQMQTLNGSEAFETDDSNNLLVQTLCNYFASRNRYEPLRQFFEEFRKTEPTVTSVIAYAQTMMTDFQAATDSLTEALKQQPESTSLLMTLAETLLAQAKKESAHSDKSVELSTTALKTILKSIALKPLLVRGWKIAARILVQLGQFEWALIMINNAPFLKNDAMIDRIGKAKYQRVTPPPDHPNMWTILEDEELEFDEEQGDEFLKQLTSLSLRGESSEVYTLLVSMFRKIGWLQLNEKKSKVLDELAVSIRTKQRKEREHQTQNDGSGSQASLTKDGHNTTSPVNRAQATENTVMTDGSLTEGSESHNPVPESNIPKEGLWGEEDVTSDGSDIEEDHAEDHQKDNTSSDVVTDSSTSTTTTSTTEPALSQQQEKRPTRVNFDENTVNLQDLNTVLESFINHFGLDSLKDRKEHHLVELGGFKANLPAVEIHRNVELAFHALFQDYKSFQQWREEEETKKSTLEHFSNVTMKNINPNRTLADWIRLGQLAYRLEELVEAERILKLITNEKFHPKSVECLVKIFEIVGDIRNCLLSSSSLSRYYSDRLKILEVHPIVEKAVLNLVSTYGLQKVRTIHAQIPDLHPSIGSTYLDSVKWRSYGFDR
ncbi:hypothetical protein SAMD00019534_100210 [Acytostelium subglobosum LB1]|uniref:hypothetical protein n=1 Tax=Acytostelium subglobosum LB1 TaxID=1410327 RepID=UPI000644EDDD|nr:hypothetical protein SAMD00019534_100210 [Acytostelium subglobosum LB1]GAM26846.1 hypothetical protein SAMD00019534_100210 [Acytostelium subglobosum LB1]|eukprot:XP_012750114.1 hypothetical protein SAMD00019534_100210 [Acytostelium subglobosum LB1]